jgi:peptidyl-prolyl cis-trans isomerase D
MGVMNYLRERMGRIVAIAIGLSLFLFILIDVVQKGSSFFSSDRDELGQVAGQKISYTDFQAQLQQAEDNFKQQSGQNNINAQFTAYLQENTWTQEVNQILLSREVDKLGLTVSPAEVSSMVNGDNPDQAIVQNFGDPQTGKVDQGKLRNFEASIKNAPASDPMAQRWAGFIKQLGTNKLAQKFMSLATNGLYVNSLDAKDDYEAKNRLVNFKYVTLDYASIPDAKVTLTDDDYKTYYDEHKYKFNNKEELRSFDYVTINGAPSKDDSAAVKDQVEKLVPAFKSSTDDSLFVQQNAETKAPLAYKKKGQLGDPKLDSVMFTAPNGFVYGPYLSNGSYKVAKLIDARTGPDSVKARHILLPATSGLDKAHATADSLKKLIQGGKSFADLAQTYSTDKSSAVKGGELGMFGRGTMVGPFDEAVFNGKKGDLLIVTTQFGVRLIEIEDQKGSAKVAKVAVVDRPVTPSQKTQSAAYSKAQAFLGAVTKGNFAAEAKKEGLTVKSANDVKALAAGVPGLDEARPVIRWVYKANVGDFGDQVYVVGDQYIVPTLTAIKQKGTLPLDAVKKQIEPDVRKQVKAKQLIDKMQSAENGSSTIDQVAQKLSLTATPVQNVVFANPAIPGLGVEYKVVGTMFGSKPNQLSKPIQGDHGVYAVAVQNFINPAPLANAVRQREQIGQALLGRSQSGILEALKDKGNVKDYRAKFL